MVVRRFYDGWGHVVETRGISAGVTQGAEDVVHFIDYDKLGRESARSVGYFVAQWSSGATYATPDRTQPVTSTLYDGLGRVKAVTDPLSNQTTNTIGVACNPVAGDSTCYLQTLTIDPLHHQSGSLVDAFGRTIYTQRFTGNQSSNYAVYATLQYTYDAAGRMWRILGPVAAQINYSYDTASRKIGLVDPDKGTENYTYDANGNLTKSVDNRGDPSGTTYIAYDWLNRPLWHNVTNSSVGAYETFSYDGGANGLGHLTGETFNSGSLSGQKSYSYDTRGRQTSVNLTIGGTSYPLQNTYTEAAQLATQTYPTGEVVTYGYGALSTAATGWLTSLSTQQGSTTTQLLRGVDYAGPGGAEQRVTNATLGSGSGAYTYAATFDALARATDLKLSTAQTLFEQTRTFDGSGNVTTANTTLPNGTDNQAFCYDEQNRLTWAGAAGTPPCSVALTAGSLTAAQYQQSFGYDNLGRLTTGPLGAYSYGVAPLHGATAMGGTYTAAYDAAGDMKCRAPAATATCAGGSPTGATLTYDNEGRLTGWQNTPTSPSTTVAFLYDNEGNRVEQQVTQSGTTTTTVYVGNVEQVATTGSLTTTTTYYYANGERIALAVNGVFSYLASDGLGSALVALNASGSATASLLYAPYGGTRYSSGTMPTDYGFTGQHADAATGLDYYNARYYDPLAGQFASADSMLPGEGYDVWGLSRYAYTEGNPVGRTDPNGHGDQYSITNPEAPAHGPALPFATNFHGAEVFSRYDAYIRLSAARFAVEPWIVAAIVAQESNDLRWLLNTTIIRPMSWESEIAITHDFGLGIGHMHIKTALGVQAAGLEPSASRSDTASLLMDEATNIDYVAAYLAQLKQQFEADGMTATPDLLIAGYNLGEPALSANGIGEHAKKYLHDVDRFKEAAQEYFAQEDFEPRDPVRGPL
jgi:RHS repeat-associated protein